MFFGSRFCCAHTFTLPLQCFTTVKGIAMLAYLLGSRFVYHDPEMQDPSEMLLLVAIALFAMEHGSWISANSSQILWRDGGHWWSGHTFIIICNRRNYTYCNTPSPRLNKIDRDIHTNKLQLLFRELIPKKLRG